MPTTSNIFTDLGVEPTAIPAFAPTTLATVGAGTITAAMIVSRLVTRSGITAAATDTTDTAANIIAAFPNYMPVLSSYYLDYVNSTAFPVTLAAGSGVTLSGVAGPIPANSTARISVLFATATAVTMNVLSIAYNAAGGFDPSSVLTQAGGSTASFTETGNLNLQISSAGVQPGGTAADNVLAVFSLPASTFDKAGRGITISAAGSFGATGNNKRVKVIFNATTAVVGSTVTGGTTVCDTAVVATNGGGWQLQASVFKFGAAGSNTQIAIHNQAQVGAAVAAMLAPSLPTATESGAILIAVTGNATTAASDIVFNWLEVAMMN